MIEQVIVGRIAYSLAYPAVFDCYFNRTFSAPHAKIRIVVGARVNRGACPIGWLARHRPNGIHRSRRRQHKRLECLPDDVFFLAGAEISVTSSQWLGRHWVIQVAFSLAAFFILHACHLVPAAGFSSGGRLSIFFLWLCTRRDAGRSFFIRSTQTMATFAAGVNAAGPGCTRFRSRSVSSRFRHVTPFYVPPGFLEYRGLCLGAEYSVVPIGYDPQRGLVARSGFTLMRRSDARAHFDLFSRRLAGLGGIDALSGGYDRKMEIYSRSCLANNDMRAG